MRAVKLIFIVCVMCIVINAQTLQGVIRDQAPDTMKTPLNSNDQRTAGSCGEANNGNGFSGTDFQIPMGTYTNNEKGLCGIECNGRNYDVCGKLGTDFTPRYAYTGTSKGNNVKSPETFRNWFHTTDQTRVVDYAVPLVKDTSNRVDDVYTFSSNSFFPIDGKGWKDWQWDNENYNNGRRNQHNYGFCYEAHSRFSYQGGEVFSFTGDDDVWVYINNSLVIDLGSLHQSLSASVALDNLGLTRGQNYRFDFFYCERHTTASNMQVTTSLYFTCSYYDWCGVCEGTGQSCCTEDIIKNKCNDNNECTTDYCGVQNSTCTHSPITCTANPCSTATCDRKLGCVQTPLNCTLPDNQCKKGECNSATDGKCVYTDVICNDGNKCTIDDCSTTSGCKYSNRTCNDNDECTDDSCDPTLSGSTTGCKNIKKSCDDNDKCTTDTCDSTIAGGCQHKNCDDGNLCTIDVCLGKTVGCSFTPKCTTTDRCQVASCSTTGVCSYSPLACTAPDICSVSQCVNGTCVVSPKSCDDGKACTVDKCSVSRGGCYYETLVCNDGNACTDNKCKNDTGCYYPTRTDIDDKKACTVDECKPAQGIIRTPLVCDDKNPCTINACNNDTGCSYLDLSCDDGNDCTTDSCNATATDPDPCVHVFITGCTGCTNDAGQTVSCTSTDRFCYPPVCDTATKKCSNTTTKCNDQNACTNDYCSAGGCKTTPVSCPAQLCKEVSCDRVQGCVYTNVTCDDADPCTTDKCTSTGECSHTVIPQCTACGTAACVTTDLCHPVVCINATTSQCAVQDFNCHVDGKCINSTCQIVATKPQCIYTPVACPSSGDACSPNLCDDTKGCQSVPIVCQTSNLCITSTCQATGTFNNTAQCIFTNRECITTDVCNPQVCNAATGACETKPVVCTDGSDCTTDRCAEVDGRAACIFDPKDCGTDQCGTRACNGTSGICFSNVLDCDDGNPCTTDVAYCNGTHSLCNYTDSGLCEDDNACTNHFCDSSKSQPCSYTNVTCFARSICETVDPNNSCDPKTGCIYQPVSCLTQTDPCKIATCDPRAGCIVEDKVCVADDNGCYKGVCDSNRTGDPCTEVSRGSWGSRFSSKDGVLCALKYNNAIKGAAIGTGAAVGIAVGAAAAAGLMGYGGKKGYDYWKTMQDQRFNGVNNNPLYENPASGGDNPLYRHSTTL